MPHELNGLYDNVDTGRREEYQGGILTGCASSRSFRWREFGYYPAIPKSASENHQNAVAVVPLPAMK